MENSAELLTQVSAVIALPTLSEVRAWDTDYLTSAATQWTNTANQWDDIFTRAAQQIAAPGGALWEGPAAHSARLQAQTDLWKVTSLSDQLQSIAGIARLGGSDLTAAKQRVLAVIGEAHGAGFSVEESLSVVDRQVGWSAAEQVVRQSEAEAFAYEIRTGTAALVALDQELAGRIASAAAGLRDVPFEATAGPAYEAAGFHLAPFPEKPPNPAPQPPPGGWSQDPLTRAAQKIAYGHSFDKHPADFSGMTRDQLAQQIESMFRANAENPGSLSIGRTADGAPVLYDPKTNIIVIRDPRGADAGTVFKPNDGAEYAETRKMTTRVPSIPPAELADGPIKPPAPVEPKAPEPVAPRATPPVRGVPVPIPPELVQLPHSVGDSDLPVLNSNGQDAMADGGTEQ